MRNDKKYLYERSKAEFYSLKMRVQEMKNKSITWVCVVIKNIFRN